MIDENTIALMEMQTAIMGEDAMDTVETQPEEHSQAQPLSQDEVHSITATWLRGAEGGDNDGKSVSDIAMKYYLGEPRGDEYEGRSEYVSTDVADMIEASLAQITPMITGQNICSFDALNEQDEDQAATESRFVNHTVERAGGYVMLHNCIKSGLLQRVAAAEVYVDDAPKVSEESYEGLNDFELAQKLQPRIEGEEVVVVEQGSMMTAMGNVHDVTVKRVMKSQKVKCEPILRDNLRWLSNSDVIEPNDSLFFARRKLVSRSDLLLEGYDPDIVSAMPPYSGDSQKYHDRSLTFFRSEQAATDLIEIWYCYPMIDSDGDGIAERRRIVLGGTDGDYFLDDQPATMVPIAMGTPYIMPGQLEGLCIYDKMKPIQDGKTKSMRQWLDNQNANNNRRTYVNMDAIEGDDIDSVHDSKPGGVIYGRRPPNEAIMPIPVDDIGPSCLGLLGYFDSVTTRKVGAAIDMQGQQQAVYNDTAHGVERQMSAKELMVSMMANNLAQTFIKQLYTLVHQVLRDNFNAPISAKFTGEWQQTNPSQWMPRDAITINVGMTKAQQQRRYNYLNELYERQLQLQAQGAPIVTPEKLHNTLADMIECGIEGDPARYYIDPQSQEGRQIAQQNAQNAQQQQMEQAQQQQQIMQAQLQLTQAELMKAQAAQEKVRMQGVIDSMKLQLQELQSMSEEGKNSADLALQYDKMIGDMALKLTEIEAQQQMQLNADYAQNKATVS